MLPHSRDIFDKSVEFCAFSLARISSRYPHLSLSPFFPRSRFPPRFYWTRQEKRKRRNMITNLESKMIFFYTQSKNVMNDVVDEAEVHLPPWPIYEMNNKMKGGGEEIRSMGKKTIQMILMKKRLNFKKTI